MRMYGKPIHPSRWYYGLGALVFFVGTAVCALIAITQFYRYFEEPKQIVIPGEKVLSFEKKGRYTLYYEYLSVVDGRVFDTGKSFIDIDPMLSHTESGVEVPFSRARITFNRYIFGEYRDAIALLNFRIDTTGDYYFHADFINKDEPPEVVLSVAPDYIFIALRTAAITIPIGLMTLIASVMVVTITYFRRREHRLLTLYQTHVTLKPRKIHSTPHLWN